MIEYALGGNIPMFENSGDRKYREIVQDTNNYIILSVEINAEKYEFKRFIGRNDILIKGGDSLEKYPINRNQNIVFSD